MQLKASRRAVKAVVTIASSAAPTGTLTITDKGRTIATAAVSGRTVSLKLPRLKRGKHVLVATFSGGSGISGSASAPQKVRVR
nr:Ig-like domain-containing protein [Nocardioides flavescens]